MSPELAELNLQPGDILVVHCGADLSPDHRKNIAREFKAEGVENTVLVLQAETRLEVIRASSQANAKAG